MGRKRKDPSVSRRNFLKTSTLSGLGATALANLGPSQAELTAQTRVAWDRVADVIARETTFVS